MSIAEKRKTFTSSEVKRRWNDAHYSHISAAVPKAMAEAFREKCKRDGISQAQIIKSAIQKYLDND